MKQTLKLQISHQLVDSCDIIEIVSAQILFQYLSRVLDFLRKTNHTLSRIPVVRHQCEPQMFPQQKRSTQIFPHDEEKYEDFYI